MLFRLAPIIYAFFTYVFRTGKIPYVDQVYDFGGDIILQCFHWIFWTASMLISYIIHPLWYRVMIFLFYPLWWIHIILPTRDKIFEYLIRLFTRKKQITGPTRFTKRFRYKGYRLYRLHCSYMVLSAIMINASHAHQFSDSVSSTTRILFKRTYAQAHRYLHQPWFWIEQHAPKYPPDGLLLWFVLGILSFVVLMTILLRGYLRILLLKRTAWFPKNDLTCSSSIGSQVFISVTTAFSTKDAVDSHLKGRVSFDSDLIQFVLDNCANVHIINDKELFESLGETTMSGVATIGGSPLAPQGEGPCTIFVKDDYGNTVPLKLARALYFPESPVNIISIAKLADSYEDDEGTFVKTSRYHSEFRWDFAKHKKTIHHSDSRIPEINVATTSNGWKSFYTFTNSFQRSLYTSQVYSTAVCTPISSETRDLPAYISDDEEDVVEEPSPSLVDLELSTLRSELSGDQCSPSLLQGPYSPWKLGDKLKYFRDGHSDDVVIEDIKFTDDSLCIKYLVRLTDGRLIVSTKEFLSDIKDDDYFHIPQNLQEYQAKANDLEPEDLFKVMHPITLTPLEQEFMDSHHSLQHAPFVEMFRMAEYGHLPKRFLKLKKKPPMCASCIFSAMKRRAWKRKSERSTTVRKLEHNRPGKGTSVDQLVSAQPGLVPRISGRHTRQRISAATCFLDHYSDFSYTHLCTSTTQEETLAAKAAYEKLAASHGVKIKSYHADNGRFAEKGFRDSVHDANQTITFCAVNAHHQNGLIEKFIQDLTRGARTLLLHAKRHWPEAIGTILWPFALKAFEDRRNHWRLDDKGRSPIQKFSNVYSTPDIKNWYTFGCPVFVLEEKAANGVIPKWNPRSRVGIYLGHSPCHAGSVALVLNPKTLHVSPQYHVVFDDNFTTVPYMKNGEIPPHWSDLVLHNTESVTDMKIELANTWAAALTPDMVQNSPFEEDINLQLSRSFEPSSLGHPLPSQDEPSPDTSANEGDQPEQDPEGDQLPSLPPDPVDVQVMSSPPEDHLRMPPIPDLDSITTRRSMRKCKASSKLKDFVTFFTMFSLVCVTSIGNVFLSPTTVPARLHDHFILVNQHFDGTLNAIHPFAFATNADNDTFTLKHMLQQEDRAEFIKAMLVELNEHESREHWTLLPRSVMPQSAKTILSIWSFKRKRFPDGRIMKYKARLCAHGGMQRWGEDYWETYSPVVNWVSVRALMVLSLIHGLETKSIDFVLAFPQADLDTDVYMELPFGFDCDGSRSYVLKLNKSLYGLKNSSRNWFQHLTSGLKTRGFIPSQVDPCILYREDCIILVYVDDCIIFSKSSKTNDDLVTSLQNGPENYQLTDEGDLTKYLGVDIDRRPDGSFELRQPYLIERCLAAMEINDKVNPKSIPATKPLLHKDKDGDSRKTQWNYRQVIGMLNYLQGSTRPDISMATHQCARFTSDPKASHERAVRYIGKYLLGTKTRGIIYKPDPKKGIECFVDADFAGGWVKADADNPENVLSRSGFTLFYAGCPVMWSSKLQTEIALSTAEAEYIALSSAMRETIPLMSLLTEISCVFELHNPNPKVLCQIYEDNESCIAMAKTQKFSPRTRHISLKYHHFRSFVEKGIIDILPIDTLEQTADIFTKPLQTQPFQYLRKKLCGW